MAAGSAGSSPVPDIIDRGVARLPGEACWATGTAPTAQTCGWKQIGVHGLIADPQLPFFIEWQSLPGACAPAPARTSDLRPACLEIAGDPLRVSEWLGESVEAPLEDVKVEWVAPHGTPGVIAVQVQTPARARPPLIEQPTVRTNGRRREIRSSSPTTEERGRDGCARHHPSAG